MLGAFSVIVKPVVEPMDRFTALDGGHKCIPAQFWCDGEEDCEDGSDEAECPGQQQVSCDWSTRDHVITILPCDWLQECDYPGLGCDAGTRCVAPELLCDGRHDCKVGGETWTDSVGQHKKKSSVLPYFCQDGSDEGLLCSERQCGVPGLASCQHRCHDSPDGHRCR